MSIDELINDCVNWRNWPLTQKRTERQKMVGRRKIKSISAKPTADVLNQKPLAIGGL